MHIPLQKSLEKCNPKNFLPALFPPLEKFFSPCPHPPLKILGLPPPQWKFPVLRYVFSQWKLEQFLVVKFKKITAELATNADTIEYKTSSTSHGGLETFELPFTVSVGVWRWIKLPWKNGISQE